MGGGGEKLPGTYVNLQWASQRECAATHVPHSYFDRLNKEIGLTYTSLAIWAGGEPLVRAVYISFEPSIPLQHPMERLLTQFLILGSPAQKGVTSYSLSPNRQGPLVGAFNAATFNSWRRFRQQVLYWAPPLIVAYAAMQWATER